MRDIEEGWYDHMDWTFGKLMVLQIIPESKLYVSWYDKNNDQHALDRYL